MFLLIIFCPIFMYIGSWSIVKTTYWWFWYANSSSHSFAWFKLKPIWSVSEKIDKIIFTNNGWYVVHDFYHIQFWVWVKLVYLCSNMFQININDRFNNEIVYPTQNPPMKFIIQKNLYFNINFFPWSIICYHFQSYFKGCVKDIANQC
jgi:hypothetical protein